MEDTATHNLLLPPSKRFKLLQPPATATATATACLPAKKRTLPPPTTTTACLPAKKRVWAPHPLSPLKHQEINEPTKKTPTKDDNNKKIEEDDDDGVTCAVCGSTDGDPSDPIVFCDGCDLMVHASCYGNPLIQSIPDGDWFCFSCCQSDYSDKVKAEHCCCCLCPKPGGAVKPTTDGGWAHILCALLVPEVFFRDPEGRDGIDCSEVPAERREVECYLCGCKSGCGIECSEPRCQLGFHVSCGIEEGLCIEYQEGRGGAIVAGFCGAHTQLWKKQQLTGKFKIVAREGDSKRKARRG